VHYLVNAAGKNANFLLNVGPMPNGKIQPEFTDTLQKIGNWMKVNSESIYGTRGNVVAAQPWGVVTAAKKIWYTHILTLPESKIVTIPIGLRKIKSATLLDGGTKLKFKQNKTDVIVNLENASAESLDTVIKLTF
jgi:alpha-L-fucosidase